jgi:serine/threonine-protein kinase
MRATTSKPKPLRVGQRLGKYKLIRRIGDGAFGVVYRARDEVEGSHVALKIHQRTEDVGDILHFFKKEIQLLSKVDHRNVLKLKNADIVDGRLFIASELGKGSLDGKAFGSITVPFAVGVLRQMLEALVEVQKLNVVHRDIKPGNIILFPGGVAKLGDFGIAKVLARAGQSMATDAGTRGYFAPEQIYGRPSFASDIFSLGLVFYEMVTAELPQWPFHWPFDGGERFNRRISPRLRAVIRKALEFDEGDRYADALAMHEALLGAIEKRSNDVPKRRMMPWRKYRELEFSARFSNLLELKFKCVRCAGPLSEYMMACPWCGTGANSFKGLASFPAVCARCEHGVKDEWEYCPWCYRDKFRWVDVWAAADKRYVKNCPNRRCGERKVMRWMHYCPWCHAKLRPWIVHNLGGRCRKCRWSVAADYWDYCAWCGEDIA